MPRSDLNQFGFVPYPTTARGFRVLPPPQTIKISGFINGVNVNDIRFEPDPLDTRKDINPNMWESLRFPPRKS